MDTIELIARAVIIDENIGKVLLCAPKNKSHYFLPGGHIEFGEEAIPALRRELLEEMGRDIPDEKFSFAGANENFFTQEGERRHEINLFFKVNGDFVSSHNVVSQENHILFEWITLSEMDKFPILPKSTIPMIEKWSRGNNILWNNEKHT
jgi:ADP-ribose pyrophosphatase YjhB (NUDIX family)